MRTRARVCECTARTMHMYFVTGELSFWLQFGFQSKHSLHAVFNYGSTYIIALHVCHRVNIYSRDLSYHYITC